MEGVTILSSFEFATEYSMSTGIALLISFGIAIISGILIAIFCDDIAFGVVCSVIAGILATGIIIGYVKPTVYETRYKVTIDETVSMIDFYEKYEVIEQEGKIFTVRERGE